MTTGADSAESSSAPAINAATEPESDVIEEEQENQESTNVSIKSYDLHNNV